MRAIRNILFIMFDQLRFDYLGCAGHPHLRTPHIDWLASRGVRFTHAYTQSPVCGASRMSTYTGRYVHSHGAAWNNFPLKVGEMTLADHLRPLGMAAWLIGKTHMQADTEGMIRLGIRPDSLIGARVAECGFDVFERDDGLWARGPDGWYDDRHSPYNRWLAQNGYDGENPWHDYANSAVDANGDLASGWLMRNATKPANIREEDSETPWLTTRAIDFLDNHAPKTPWLCHLSYIKPHWPYIAPAPWHQLYGPQHVVPAIRDTREQQNPHPVFAAFMNSAVGRAFQRDDVRTSVIPAYMGLIAQCDDQLGRLFAHLQDKGHMEDTLIVVTSDHGDYLGDHWLGEKDFFHNPSVRVPLIIYDPSPEADATRGSTSDALVEQIDLAATFIEAAGGSVPAHIVEGRSLLPNLRGTTPAADWRRFVISEYDYSQTPMAAQLGVSLRDARLFMLADRRWKLIHAEGGFRPMLFDQDNDPMELADLGGSPNHQSVIVALYDQLATWSRRPSQRTTMSDVRILEKRGKSRRKGVLLGAFDPSELGTDLLQHYRGPGKPTGTP